MADVTIQCMNCGNEIKISDVVDVSKLKCRACGGDFLRSNATAAPAGPSPEEKRRSLMKDSSSKISLKPAGKAPPDSESPKADPEKEEGNRLAWEKLNNPKGQQDVQKQSGKMYSALTWKAWMMFFIIGIVAGVLRYSGVIPAEILDQAVLYEALTVVILMVFIILKAFQDSVFQGVFCVLLPPYTFYYLFSASDDFYLRGLVAGLMVGLGQDSAVAFHKWSLVAIEYVNKWIASGG